MSALTDRLRNWRWPIAAIIVSASMLAAAHGFEHFGKLAPCELCLRQREVYWAAIAMAVAGLGLWRLRPSQRFLIALNVLLGLVFVTGMIVAVYHAGVEWNFWPGPTSCTTGVAGDLAAIDLLGELETRQAVVSCGVALWSLLGISMAGWNALASLVFAGLSFMAARASSGQQA